MTIYVVIIVDPIDGVTLVEAFESQWEAENIASAAGGKVKSVELVQK